MSMTGDWYEITCYYESTPPKWWQIFRRLRIWWRGPSPADWRFIRYEITNQVDFKTLGL